MGSWARRESLAMPVTVKTPVIFSAGSSLVSGVLDRVTSPMSVDAVLARTSISCRLGGKSFRRSRKWLGGERFRPKGGEGSLKGWKRKLDGGCRVTRWNSEGGALSGSNMVGVCARRKTLFSSQVMEET